MYLIVGLGNPGSKYALTRHNIGFMAADLFAMSAGSPPWKEEFNSHTCKFKMDGEEILLAKPMTFMNKSGESVQALMSFYKIPTENLIVAHDELDIPFSQIRIHSQVPATFSVLGCPQYCSIKAARFQTDPVPVRADG